MKLADALKIAQTAPAAGAEKFNVYLACGILPLHLGTFLAAYLSKRMPGRIIEIQNGLYGDLPGNLAQLTKSSSHAGAVAIEWSDLDPRLGLRRLGGWGPDLLPDIRANVERRADQLLHLLEAAARLTPIVVCLPTLPLPPISYQPGEQFLLDQMLLEKTVQDFALTAASIRQVKIVNRQRLDAISPCSERLDVKSELSTGFPYRTAHASRVAQLISALIEPRQPKKGLITDLDDTLWRGILGEEGVQGISWELDRHSHIHALYQQLLGALSESGVLLGIASRNDPSLVIEALNREDMILPKDRVFPIEVNWNQKSRAVRRILEAWNINAESAVFVDDSPLELAEVNSLYPTMTCLLFPKDDDQLAYGLFEQLRDLFGKPAVFEEDRLRGESLRRSDQFRRHKENRELQSPETFLRDVEAELILCPVPADDLRAFELVNKTNQFNLNGRRFNDPEFKAALNRPGAVSLLVCYKDKYGPLGKIAVLLGVAGSSRLKIDTWVMSCRAFGRHIEHGCLDYLYESLGVSEIELDFQPTTRNSPVREFLSQFVEGTPTDSLRIRRETFMRKKPKLFHKLNEGSYV